MFKPCNLLIQLPDGTHTFNPKESSTQYKLDKEGYIMYAYTEDLRLGHKGYPLRVNPEHIAVDESMAIRITNYSIDYLLGDNDE